MNRHEQDAHEDLCQRLVTALNERDAARAEGRREGYLVALNAWHEAESEHCAGECFRESAIRAALGGTP